MIFMLTNKNLKFEHGEILTRSMLHEIYKYPREFLRLKYSNYSNGIICGLDFFIDGSNLILTAGVIKLDDEFYFLEKNLNISALAEKNNLAVDKEYFICLKKFSVQKEPCLTENNFEVIFGAENLPPILGSFIFTGKENFNLPKLIEGDNPFENIFRRSVFNLCDVEFSANGGSTFHPLLFRLVKEFLLIKENKTPLDYAILVQLQNSETISLQTIKSYIESENKKISSDRKILLETFCDCLVNAQFKLNYILSQLENADNDNNKKFSSVGKLLR